MGDMDIPVVGALGSRRGADNEPRNTDGVRMVGDASMRHVDGIAVEAGGYVSHAELASHIPGWVAGLRSERLDHVLHAGAADEAMALAADRSVGLV